MKIAFVVNTTGLTGGIKVIFEYANRFIEIDHEVSIIHPLNLNKNRLLKILKYKAKGLLKIDKVDWFPLKSKVLRVSELSKDSIPDFDVIIATANEIASEVAKLPDSKGQKFYFVQDYETWTRDHKKVDQTYKLPLKKIVIASWLKDLIENKFGQKVLGVITNGVDMNIFNVPKKHFNKNKHILMLYHVLKKKGINDGIKAYKIAKEKFPNIKLSMFSVYHKGNNVPAEVEFRYKPSQDELTDLYASSDIFLSPSWQEGCQLPPMEAMASQCAVIATNVGGIPDYAVSGKTALVVPPKRPDLLAKALIDLLNNEEKLEKIARAGYKHIKNFTWEKSAQKFETILEKEIGNEKS